MRWVRVHNLEDGRAFYLNIAKFYCLDRCEDDKGQTYTYIGLSGKIGYMIKESPEEILSGA